MRGSRAPYIPIGETGTEKKTASEVARSIRNSVSSAWQATSVAGLIFAVCAVALAITGVVYGYNAWVGQAVQDARTNQVEASVVAAQTTLSSADTLLDGRITAVNGSLVQINTTLINELAMLEALINIVSGANGTIRSLNGVVGSNGTLNVDLIAGAGVAVTPLPSSNQVRVDNTGATSVNGGSCMPVGLALEGNSTSTGDVCLTNTGVVTVNGVPSGSAAPGQLELLGTGMIAIVNTPNSSQVTVDGSAIVTTLVNLQNENSMQYAEIQALQNTTAQLQMQLSAVQMAGDMIATELNGTQIEVNMTITSLIAQVAMNQMEIAALQAQLANLTAVATPTGTLVPWTGTAMNVPSSYLLADGTEYSQTLYPDLFAVIATNYCPGPCTIGMFAVPDMRGRVPVGMAPSGAFNAAIGVVVGVETNTLTTNELPAHTHSGTTSTVADHDHGTHSHNTFYSKTQSTGSWGPPQFGFTTNFQTDANAFAENTPGLFNSLYGARLISDISTVPAAGSHSHTFTTSSAGLGAAFTNVQPSVVMHYMIKT